MTEQVDLPWLIEARKFIGEKEIKGNRLSTAERSNSEA